LVLLLLCQITIVHGISEDAYILFYKRRASFPPGAYETVGHVGEWWQGGGGVEVE
jgi:hypothetical protein